MRLVTQSLFPPFRISCSPIEGVPRTQTRLMAGYLMYHEDLSIASVLYCELHPQSNDTGRLVFYENELCQTHVMDIIITETSMCCEKVGINCSCFCVEDHQFGTRTLAERKLWLRAISNVKVKLQNRAPPPSSQELGHYRRAIKEHVVEFRLSLETSAPMDPLLQRAQTVLGGRCDFVPPSSARDAEIAGVLDAEKGFCELGQDVIATSESTDTNSDGIPDHRKQITPIDAAPATRIGRTSLDRPDVEDREGEVSLAPTKASVMSGGFTTDSSIPFGSSP